jgi:hypothetical protein
MTFSKNGLIMTLWSSSVRIDDILVYSRTVEEHVETPTFIKGVLFHKLREQIPIVCQVLEMQVWCTRKCIFPWDIENTYSRGSSNG